MEENGNHLYHYTPKNIWKNISSGRKEASRRFKCCGVEVKALPLNHFLFGQYGLFALQEFAPFDIIGEYTGLVVNDNVTGIFHLNYFKLILYKGNYVATLEATESSISLGVDALRNGNEMRFINAYQHISDMPNVKMQTAYIETYPHLIIICTKNIAIGEEILLDYGAAYAKEYFGNSSIHSSGDIANISWDEFPNLDVER